MIIKEYRIPMPLGVDEYQIAQLYMIAKKSRLESKGEGSGVEILTNEPYQDGPGGNGQYTDKLYHIAHHLPVWLRGFLPKSLSTIKEEAWNAYPYSKNRIVTPFMEKFSIDVESKYLQGGTDKENVFNLEGDDLSERIVDTIDFVKEKPCTAESTPEEDPLVYVSSKKKRGPLTEDWLHTYQDCHVDTDKDVSGGEKTANQQEVDAEADQDDRDRIMCVYKLCKVQFGYWPMQYRVEQFVHDYIRKELVRAHRQAWAWQDEWLDLTMDDIRKMEKETQECLTKMMHSDKE